MSVSQQDIKKLFSLSAGICNICKKQLIENNTQIAEMAHIIAKSSSGARGSIFNINNNSYNNLILLCPNCHTKVDKYPDEYPVQKLINLKKEHENFIHSRLNIRQNYLRDLSSLNILFGYISIKNFRGMAIDLPNKISINFNAKEIFEQFYIDNPDKYPFWDAQLTELWESFLYKIDNINNLILGSITTKTNKFITKNELMNNIQNNELCYNIYVSDYSGSFMILNKEYLNNEQIHVVHKEITNLVQEFIYAHTELINYIRYNYKDIRW